VIRFSSSDRSVPLPMATYLARRRSSASRLRRRPRLVGNSGSEGCPRRSWSHVRSETAVPGGERSNAVLAPLAVAADVRAGAEVHVAAVKAGELGGAQPGLDGEQQQGVVSPAGPGRTVGRGEQRVDLGLGEVGDVGAVEPFDGDREHALDDRRVLGMPQGREAEQRVDRREPGVVAYVAISTVLLAGGRAEAPLVIALGAGGLGLGIQFSAMLAHLTQAVGPRHAPDISGMFTTTLQIAGAIGVAAFGSAYLSLAGAGDAAHAFAAVTAAFAVLALLAAGMAHRAIRSGEGASHRS
jgi:hypothetical protein